MQISSLVSELCEKLQVPVPKPDPKGRFVLDTPDGLKFRVYATDSELVLDGTVLDKMPSDENNAEALARSVLKTALSRARKWPEAPYSDPETGELGLLRRIPVDVSTYDFLEAAEEFLNRIEFWQKNTEAVSASGVQASRPDVFLKGGR